MTSWYRNNPRHLKVCECCGNEFKTNDTAQKYCSRECAGKSISRVSGISRDNEKRRTRNEQRFIENFNRKFGKEFEYIDGYVGNNSIITIRCKTHNTTFTRGAAFFRKGDNPNCPICKGIAREQKKQLSAEQRRIEQEELDEARQQKREQKRERDIKNRTKECAYCGKVFISKCGNTCCSDKCKRKYFNHKKDITRRHKLLENGKVDYSITLEKLIKRDKNRCHICGSKCNINDYVIDDNGYFVAGDDYPSIDHLNPVAKGGTHTWDNIKLAHRGCNNAKSDNNCFIKSDGQVVLSI